MPKYFVKMTKEEITKSIEVLKKIAPNLAEALIKRYYTIKSKRKSDHEEALRIIRLYTVLQDIEEITGRKLQVLACYLIDGYNKESKKRIRKKLNISEGNLNSVNCDLRSRKLIYPDDRNSNKNHVTKELLDLKTFLIDDKKSNLLIQLA